MSGIRVLLVDDEVEFTASMSRVLRRRGFDVEVADNGLAALPLVAGKAFDVVVLDVKMPGMDGIQALQEIKRLSPETRVLVLTGHFSIGEEEELSAGGAYAYLLKPFPILKLVGLITSAAGHPPA